MRYKHTKHANQRCQQRGIPIEVVNFIINHGEAINTHKKTKHFLTKQSLEYLKRDFPEVIGKYDKQLASTAIVTVGDNVITAMKIQHRLRF
jgi:hypothetical protein